MFAEQTDRRSYNRELLEPFFSKIESDQAELFDRSEKWPNSANYSNLPYPSTGKIYDSISDDFQRYKFLRVKDESFNSSKIDILKTLYHLSKIIGFSYNNIITKWFEGTEGVDLHLHCIICKNDFTDKQVGQWSSAFKRSRLKETDIQPSHRTNPFMDIIEDNIPLTSWTFWISPFTNKEHFLEVAKNYQYKHLIDNVQFID